MAKLPPIPKWSIDRRVGNIHVGTPDAQVYAETFDIAAKTIKEAAAGKARSITGAPMPEYKGLTEKQQLAFAKHAADYAVARHQKNRGVYVNVVGGRVGAKTRRVPL